jgi:DNA-binding NarL/FixJ family response regulator
MHLDHPDATTLSTRDGTADPLTVLERELANLIAEGLSNEQIARGLVVTPGTVANHIAHIIDKMQVHSPVQSSRPRDRGEAPH